MTLIEGWDRPAVWREWGRLIYSGTVSPTVGVRAESILTEGNVGRFAIPRFCFCPEGREVRT